MLAALALAAILAYLLRVSLAPAETTVERELGLDGTAMGYVLGGFFVGYFWLQVPAGWLGDRLGARVSLTLMAWFWALSIAMTAGARSESMLLWSRYAQGAAQAGLFAVTILALAAWFPAARRGMASAVITGSMSIGAALANALTVRLLDPFGWRATFLAYAAVVVVWSLAFFAWFRDTPDHHRAVNQAERDLIRGPDGPDIPPPDEPDASRTPLLPALSAMAWSLSMWALCMQSIFRAFGYAFFITWFPAYLEKGHGVKLTSAGDLSVLPLLGVVLGSFVGGWVVDTVLTRTGSKWLSRSGVASAALALCGLTTLASVLARQPLAAVIALSIGTFFSGLGGPTTWAATIDVCPEQTAVGFSIMNMAGNIGAWLCPVIIGRMIDHIEQTHGDWNMILYLVTAVYFAGAVSWLFLDPNRPARAMSRAERV